MKRRPILLSSAALVLLSCSLLAPAETIPAATQPTVAEPAAVPTEAVDVEPSEVVPASESDFGSIARGHLEALTVIGPRVTGSTKEQEARQYIIETFTKLSYAAEAQTFSARSQSGSGYTSANVIAVKTGDSPKEIVVGAHYDSASEGLGTDDNASGVAVLLEAAERIAGLRTPYTIRFITFGSEENDLDGSYFYVESMTKAEVRNTLAMVNLDSLAAGDNTYVYSVEGENAFLRDWVLAWAGKSRVPLQTIPDVDLTSGGEYFSDYGAFHDKGIPFIYFEATNWDLGEKDGYTQVDPKYGDDGFIWHTKYDNLEYLDATFPGRVDEHLETFVSALVAICTEFQQ